MSGSEIATASGFPEERVVAPPSPALSFPEIERVLEITDRLEIDRERVRIPLRREGSGRIARDARGGLEIVVPADRPFEEWLASLEPELRKLGGSAG
jgi:hypothetical protein